MRFSAERLGMASLLSQVHLGVSPAAIDVRAPPSVPSYVLDYGEDFVSFLVQSIPTPNKQKMSLLVVFARCIGLKE